MLKSSGRTQEDIARIIPKTAEERRQEAVRITKNIDSIPYLMSNITSLQRRIEVLEKVCRMCQVPVCAVYQVMCDVL
jgi:hypothetical protein